MKSRIIIPLLWVCFMTSTFAQKVSTVLTQSGSRFEGITWADNGLIYTVDFASGGVYKLTPQGDIEKIGPNFGGALGGAIDKDYNFYFSEFNSGKIIKIKPDDSYETYATGLKGPTGILIDDEKQIMYVANYSGNNISKIDMTAADPSPEVFATSSLFKGPDGLVFSPEGDLISANFESNIIQKITPDGTVSKFTTVTESFRTGYLVRVGDLYYVTGANGTPDIYKITLDGVVSRFAGTGQAGYQDGDADEAKFVFPNGIAASPGGDSLIIAESGGAGRIRMITDLADTTITTTSTLNLSTASIAIHPNPASDYLSITFDLPQKEMVAIDLLDVKGERVDTILPMGISSGEVDLTYPLKEKIKPGIYIVRFQIGKEMISRRLVVE